MTRDIVRVVIIGRGAREAESYYNEHREEYAGQSITVMSVQQATTSRLRSYGRGVRLDVLPKVSLHKQSKDLESVIRLAREHGAEVRWCPAST